MDKTTKREQLLAEREQLFINATREQICQKGLLGVQMATIAKACDYATGTLYHHFNSKEDLLMAVCTCIAADRIAYFRRVYEWDAPSRQRMFAYTVASSLFAQHHPEHFRLEQYIMTEVIWQACAPQRRQAFLAAMRPAGEMANSIVEQAVQQGDVDAHGHVPLAIASGQWTMSTGMQTLVHADGMLAQFGLNAPYQILLRNIQLQLNALNWRPLFTDPFDNARLQNEVDQVTENCFADLCTDKGSFNMEYQAANRPDCKP